MDSKNTDVGILRRQFRRICFTIYDNDEGDIFYWLEKLKSWKGVEYCIVGREVCPTTGRNHLQGYCEFRSPKLGKTIKNWNNTMNFREARGTKDQNEEYCSKDRDFFEWGEPKKQGARTDLYALRDEIKEGKSVDDICMENPYAHHTYGRTLQKIEDIRLRKLYRTWRTKGIYRFGKTQTGKSYHAYMIDCSRDPDETYSVKKNDKGWQDGYTGQKWVVINEFRGQIPFGELLELVDEWPYTLSRRAKEPVPFLAEKVVITSSLPPEEVYRGLLHKDDRMEQFYERFTVIEHISKTETRIHKWSEGNTEPLTDGEKF